MTKEEVQDFLKSHKEKMEEEIKFDKHCRVGLDGFIQAIKKMPQSRERSLAITKIQEGVMWLGMDLKRLGNPNPYPNGYNPENAVVDKTADGLKL